MILNKPTTGGHHTAIEEVRYKCVTFHFTVKVQFILNCPATMCLYLCMCCSLHHICIGLFSLDSSETEVDGCQHRCRTLHSHHSVNAHPPNSNHPLLAKLKSAIHDSGFILVGRQRYVDGLGDGFEMDAFNITRSSS